VLCPLCILHVTCFLFWYLMVSTLYYYIVNSLFQRIFLFDMTNQMGKPNLKTLCVMTWVEIRSIVGLIEFICQWRMQFQLRLAFIRCVTDATRQQRRNFCGDRKSFKGKQKGMQRNTRGNSSCLEEKKLSLVSRSKFNLWMKDMYYLRRYSWFLIYSFAQSNINFTRECS